MTKKAKTSFGVELWLAPATSPLVKVAEMLTVTPPTQSRETIDVTTHDSPAGAMEFIVEEIFDTGEISFQVHYIAGSDGDDAILTALTSGAEQDWKIVLKSESGTEDLEGAGFVTSYGPSDMPVNGKQAADCTIKVSGPISQAATV